MALRLWQRREGGNYSIRGTHATAPGRRIDKSLGHADKARAERQLAEYDTRLWRSHLDGPQSVVTFGEAVVSFLEKRGVKDSDAGYLERLLTHFGTTLLKDIDQAAVDQATRSLVTPGASDATKRRAVYTPLLSVLRHAARRGWCQWPALERPSDGPGRVRFLWWPQVDRLLSECSPRMAALLTFMFYTGCRWGEARDLDLLQDVSLPDRLVTFRNTKNGRDRTIWLPRPAVEALASIPHDRGSPFRTWWPGERVRGQLMKTVGPAYQPHAKLRLHRPLKRAGIEDFHPHDTRHHWATWFCAETKDLQRCQQLGGWKSLAMVERYAHVIPDGVAVPIRLSRDVEQTASGANLVQIGGGAPS